LLSPQVEFYWGPEARESSQALKQALTQPPILAMPIVGELFTLDTDASDLAIGAVLSQSQNNIERVISYASRKLSRAERNYSTTRKELLAVVFYMKFFRHYLLNVRFRVRTDHAAILWLRKTPEPIGQQARWIEIMEMFQFTVEHRPGKAHSNADAMSRKPDLSPISNNNEMDERDRSNAVQSVDKTVTLYKQVNAVSEALPPYKHDTSS